MTELRAAALEYAQLGWPVLPLYTWRNGACSCGSSDCASPAKHPLRQLAPNGLKNATTDLDKIGDWWDRFPNANVGLRTGDAFDVLDIDGPEGEQNVVDLCNAHGNLPEGPAVRTGGGGQHLLFLPTGVTNRAGLVPKVDWRGKGGYIVAAPSLHASGNTYNWIDPATTPLEPVPEWLRLILDPPKPERVERPASDRGNLAYLAVPGQGTRYGIAALEAELEELGRAVEGTRNHALNAHAFNLYQLVAGDELDEHFVYGRLQDAAIGIGLTGNEIEGTLRSAKAGGLASPRYAPALPPRLAATGTDGPVLDPETIAQAVNEERELLKVTITAAGTRSHITGGTFILDAPDKVEAVWGDGDGVAWAAGEPLMINGPTGVGKTTIAQQVVLGRLGLRNTVLDMPVAPTNKRVLYIAADRPKQAARSFRRMVNEADRETLDDRLEVWRGPLPTELTKHPELLVAMADHYGADTIVVDSLKDVVAKLSDDESANRANNAFQACSAMDIELVILHHQRKAQAENRKPSAISDVFGSTWLTAGMGSVLLVWGQPGDPIVEVSHLKQPAEPIGPLTVLHDHDKGYSSVQEGIDLYAVIRTSRGLTAEAAATLLFKTDNPKPADVEKARRKLKRLVTKGLVTPQDGGKSATGQQLATRYYAIERNPE